MDSGRGWSSLGWSHTLKEGGTSFAGHSGRPDGGSVGLPEPASCWRSPHGAGPSSTGAATTGITGPWQRPCSLPSQAPRGCVVRLGSSGPEGVADELWRMLAGWGSCWKSSVPQQPPSAAQVHSSASWVTSSVAGHRALHNGRLSVKAFTVTVT